MMRARVDRALAISTICCWAIDSVERGVEGIDVEANLLQRFAGASLNCGQVHNAASVRLATEENIGGNAQVIAQIELLVNKGDAQFGCAARRIDVNRRAIYGDLAFIRELNAGQYFHQRAFTRPILAD